MNLFEQFRHCLNNSKNFSIIYTDSVSDDGDPHYSTLTVSCKAVAITLKQLIITIADSYKLSFDIDWSRLVSTSCNEYSYVGVEDSKGCLFWVQ